MDKNEQIAIAKMIVELVHLASNTMRFDGVRYKITKKPIEADSIDELYKKSRTAYFDFDTKIKIMAGYYLMGGENVEKYYFKALKILKSNGVKL